MVLGPCRRLLDVVAGGRRPLDRAADLGQAVGEPDRARRDLPVVAGARLPAAREPHPIPPSSSSAAVEIGAGPPSQRRRIGAAPSAASEAGPPARQVTGSSTPSGTPVSARKP